MTSRFSWLFYNYGYHRETTGFEIFITYTILGNVWQSTPLETLIHLFVRSIFYYVTFGTNRLHGPQFHITRPTGPHRLCLSFINLTPQFRNRNRHEMINDNGIILYHQETGCSSHRHIDYIVYCSLWFKLLLPWIKIILYYNNFFVMIIYRLYYNSPWHNALIPILLSEFMVVHTHNKVHNIISLLHGNYNKCFI